MRIATCVNDLKIVLNGSKGSRAIGKGWQGDLDEVLGEQVIPAGRVDPDDPKKEKVLEAEKRIPVTIADMLGDHLNDTNFKVEPKSGKAGNQAPKAPQPS